MAAGGCPQPLELSVVTHDRQRDHQADEGTPEDVALAAVFLASDSAAWLTGVTLDVAGGYVMT
jgi:NAD(P)-dependent dehydrogenase (short-subunit alcohol dehydrogenase family)